MFECEITLCNIDGWLENIKPAIIIEEKDEERVKT